MTLLVNIIGSGNLGKTIAYLLVKNKTVTIASIYNRSKESSIKAIEFIGQGSYCPSLRELQPADITFITTPDDAIAKTCETLSENQYIKKESIVLHCSGSLTSDVLASIKKRGCYIASVHPMRSFAKPELSIEQYPGTYCAIEGDGEAIAKVRYLFNSIGSITYEIDTKKKSLYHAAGIFASNYLVTLSQQALLCMNEAGVDNETAMRALTNIMRGTVANLESSLSPAESLTGPIRRGDISTIMKHMEFLEGREQKPLYATLAKATLQLTDHPQEKKRDILSVLEE